ncbi:hypothetical protein GJ496_004323 [Pomphorhynchus laevis]|nr:hypothetical protein GJ496_004323 [Pomphorhynchus laevis]
MLFRRKICSKIFVFASLFWIMLVIFVALKIDNQEDNLFNRQFESRHKYNMLINSQLSNHTTISNSISYLSDHKTLQAFHKYSTLRHSTDFGYEGLPVIIDAKNLSTKEKTIYDQGWTNHAFNEYASNLISVHRYLPDFRDDRCPKVSTKGLPDASVIIIFHQEAWSTLLRTVHSVIDRSPAHLLKEVVLVDDKSTFAHLQKPLEDYISLKFPDNKVKLIRMEERMGLIQARIRGATEALGQVLIFLDSHCEATIGWIEPLLDLIAKDSRVAVVPTIESINDNTLAIKPSKIENAQIGGFDWDLIFRWYQPGYNRSQLRKENPLAPLESPTMAGGLFAINRNWFAKLGMYDPGMRIWGGENLELSFKVWMCGGRIVTAVCSHVGHIFRSRSPYSWGSIKHVLMRNLLRLALVWLDDFAQIYINKVPKHLRNVSFYGDISEQIELRKNLKCHDFAWYRNNIFPELFVPADALKEGAISNRAVDYCIDCGLSKSNIAVIGFKCHGNKGNQLWYLSKERGIRRDIGCLVAGNQGESLKKNKVGIVNSKRCLLDMYRHKHFLWNFSDGFLKSDMSNNLCLELATNNKDLIFNDCNRTNMRQQWYWN